MKAKTDVAGDPMNNLAIYMWTPLTYLLCRSDVRSGCGNADEFDLIFLRKNLFFEFNISQNANVSILLSALSHSVFRLQQYIDV